MKPMNWISATGFSPWAAMPTVMPVISVSASGVSITRRKPKRSYSPRVARNTPPLGPTSSPSTTTSGSPAIARCSARLMASTMHSVFCSAMVASLRGSAAGHQLVALATIAIRQPLVEMIESRAGVLVRHRTEALDRRIDLIAQFLLQLLLALLVPQALAVEEALQAPDGFALPGLGQLIGAAVPA